MKRPEDLTEDEQVDLLKRSVSREIGPANGFQAAF